MKTFTLKNGDTATARKIWAGTTVAGAPAPSASENGYSLQGADWLHVYVDLLTGATAATVIVWYFSDISNQWYQGDSVAITATDKIALIEVRGEFAAYFQVSSITGGGGTVDLWAGYSYEGQTD